MDWGTALWDQHDAIEKHTLLGQELIERYMKFIKERAEIEQNYAKQLRGLCKKYSRRGSKEDLEMKFSNQQTFQNVVTELNECAAHRETMAENMSQTICVELNKCLHEIKQERKTHLNDIKKAQQNLEASFKQLENTKKRFEKEWKEAEKANLHAERVDQDPASTKVDADKAKMAAHQRTHMADECKNDYAAQLQKYNKEQNNFYRAEMPSILNKLQQMEERRVRKLSEGYGLMAEAERNTIPLVIKCLERISMTSSNTDEKQDTQILIEQHKSGLAPPADVEFEDYSQGFRPAAVENTYQAKDHTKGRIKHLFKKNKQVGTLDRIMPPPVDDLSQLPSDQRKKRLQEKVDEIKKNLQKETDQSEALSKMRHVYEQNSQLGDPTSLDPEISQTTHTLQRLRGELNRYEAMLSEAGGTTTHNDSPDSGVAPPSPEFPDPPECPFPPEFPDPPELDGNVYEFDEDFDEEAAVAQCMALYDFNGDREGEVSMQTGDHLRLLNEDSGDGWVRVKRTDGGVGYVPASYVKII